MKPLADALRFLTIIPIPGKCSHNTPGVSAAYPWAGLILGFIVALVAWTGGWIFSPAATAVIAVAVRILITGGLHMDGLADLADGAGGGQDREKRLIIMADSHLGTFGVLAILLMVALQITITAELMQFQGNRMFLERYFPLIVAPAFSRGIIPLLMRVFPSARPGGTGDRSRSTVSVSTVVLALISLMCIALLFYGLAGLTMLALITLLLLATAAGISRGLGGLTGDIYGAMIETGDLLTLFGVLLIARFHLSTPGLLHLIL